MFVGLGTSTPQNLESVLDYEKLWAHELSV